MPTLQNLEKPTSSNNSPLKPSRSAVRESISEGVAASNDPPLGRILTRRDLTESGGIFVTIRSLDNSIVRLLLS
jgi:hypothetical protein